MEPHDNEAAAADLIEVVANDVAVEPAATQVKPDTKAGTGSASTEETLTGLARAMERADIPASGFENALRSALAASDGTLLFVMPGATDEASVAAVSLGAEHETLLAVLDKDGGSVRFEKAGDSSHPVAGLAASWTRVMERMPAIAA